MRKSALIAFPPRESRLRTGHGAPALTPAIDRTRRRAAAAAAAGCAALFAYPLYELMRFAAGSDLYSYIALIPAVSGYLVWLERDRLRVGGSIHRLSGALLLALGLAGLAAATAIRIAGIDLPVEDRLAVTSTAAVVTLAGLARSFLSPVAFRAVRFPLGFLVFLIPLPNAAMAQVEIFMQHGSAAVARALFEATDTTVFYQDLTFHLPGIHLLVAPECSGMRSTLVLFILSVLAGGLFLRSPRHRLLVVLAILPLALLRNGFRIFVIGELCVHLGPHMIDSLIHRRGGPLFFALSLVPLFLLLFALKRREQRPPVTPVAAALS